MRNILRAGIIALVALVMATDGYAQRMARCQPQVVFAGHYQEGLTRQEVLAASGMRLRYPDCEEVKDSCHIIRYTIDVMRKREAIYSKTFYGEHHGFDAATIKVFNTLKAGDTLYFHNIHVYDWDKLQRQMADLKLYISDKKAPGGTNGQSSNAPLLVERVVAITDSVYDVAQKSMIAYQDTALARILVEEAKAGKIKAYAPAEFDRSKVLSVAAVNKIFDPFSDTEEVENVNGEKVKKVNSGHFRYSALHSFKVLEKWTKDKTTGKQTFEIVAIAPLADWYISEYDDAIGYKNLFWLDYKDVEEKVIKYQSPFLKRTFSQAERNDHMKKGSD